MEHELEGSSESSWAQGEMTEAPPPRPKPEPRPDAPLQREDIERMLEELRRDVREIVEGRAAASPAKSGRARKAKG